VKCYASASKTLPAHHLAGAHKGGAIYSSRRAPRCGRGRGRHVLACRGRAGETMALLNILHCTAASVLETLLTLCSLLC
jgi:hypothetical protein